MSKQNELAQLADAVTVDGSNVGIGTNNPLSSVHMAASSGVTGYGNSIFLIEDTGSDYSGVMFKGQTNYNAAIRSEGSSAMTFWRGDTSGTAYFTETMRLDASGRLLVNTPSVLGSGKVSIKYTSTTETGITIQSTIESYNTAVQFLNTAGTQVGTINTGTSSTAYNTSSDYRLKENLVDLTGASARVNQLNPLRFNWITDDTNTAIDGFLAHEVATVVPEAITGTKDAMMDEEYEVTPAVLDDDGNVTTEAVMGTRSVPDYQGIDQSKLVPLLTAALQEALTEIASLKTRVEALEA